MLLWAGANAAGVYKIGNLGILSRPLLCIPMNYGDSDVVALLLRARADPSACDSDSEPILCHSLRNVLSGGEGARGIFNQLLARASKLNTVPDRLRESARLNLAIAVKYARRACLAI